MNYSPPADQVVFDNDPGRVRQLLRSPEFELVPEYVSTVIRAPIPCERFFELASPPGINMGFGTLFLHERRNSKGERRLVLLRLGGPVMRSLHSEDPAMNEPLVFRPGTAFSDPIEVRSRWTGSTDLPYGLGGRWFAGQIETDDPSHFSVVNENYGRRFIIDGWLMDDDTIKLEKRR
jgi:hypothetical protein